MTPKRKLVNGRLANGRLAKLIHAASETQFRLEMYLLRIEKEFSPSTEVSGELFDCLEALTDALRAYQKRSS